MRASQQARTIGLVVAVTLARVPKRLLACKPTLFGWLGVSHVGAVDAEHAAAVYGAFETAKGAIDRLVVADFDSYGHRFLNRKTIGGAFQCKVIRLLCQEVGSAHSGQEDTWLRRTAAATERTRSDCSASATSIRRSREPSSPIASSVARARRRSSTESETSNCAMTS